ncbi:MAG: hypothetical protein FJ225_08260 [Lentisphaerae bacterium]|nr:hypothetical protein [Lentisphaerota bacterium]
METMTVAPEDLTQCLGDGLDYSNAMTSFSPFYSDIGLGIGNDSGIQCLFLHYNRITTRFLDPFLSMPRSVKAPQCTATGITQFFQSGVARIAFCEHNTWVVECEGVAQIDFGVAHAAGCQDLRHSTWGDDIHLFDVLLPTGDKRDPDQHFPLVLGLRVITGALTAGAGIEAPLRIEADPASRIVLAFSVRILDVGHESIVRRLQAASLTAEDAVRRTQSWLEQAMSGFRAEAGSAHERSVLARCVHALLSNSTEAPGHLGGRIAAFPSRGTYPTHFLWDSCFQNLATEMMHPGLAEDSLLLLTENLRCDGKMAHFLCSTWMRPHESQPPLVGWAGLRLVRARNNVGLARRLLPTLQRNTRWWREQRMTRFGLIAAKNGLETGWDDSPRFDRGPTVACDMNSYLLMQMRACAEFSRMLGDEAGAAAQTAEADRYAQRVVDVLFDKESGLFWDVHVASGEPVRIKTPACFLPLLADVPISLPTARDSIRKVLLNSACFFGKVPFPSVAYDETCYQPNKWWRGPVWLPVAYLMLILLDKTGFRAEAASARASLYQMIINDTNIREFFNSQTGEGLGAHEQGWTAAICLRLHREIHGQGTMVEQAVARDG